MLQSVIEFECCIAVWWHDIVKVMQHKLPVTNVQKVSSYNSFVLIASVSNCAYIVDERVSHERSHS